MEVKTDQVAAELLRYPLKTSEHIHENANPDQYEKIRIQVEKYPLNEPHENIQLEETSNPITDSIFNSIPEEFPTSSDQNGEFIVYLKDAEQDPTPQQKHEIHSRKNPNLVATMDEDDLANLANYVHELRPDLPPDVEQNVIDDVTRYVAERITAVIDDEIELQSEASNGNSPALDQPTTTPPDEIEQNLINDVTRYVAERITDGVDNEIKPQSEASNSPPPDHPSTIPSQSVDYTIPGIDRNLIEGLQGPVDQTWQGTDHHVRFKRNSPDGDVELWWKKGDDDIYLHAFPSGAADQNWGFGNVHLGLFRDEDGYQTQVWDFGDAKLEYITSKDSSYHRVWEFDNRDEASYWKYRHFIKLWCNANDFFVGKESCIIY